MTKYILHTLFLSILISVSCLNLSAQGGERIKIQQKVDSFFIAMAKGDTNWMSTNLLPECNLITVSGGNAKNEQLVKDEFLKALIKYKDGKMKIDERLLNYSIRIDDNYAVVSSDYSLYVNSRFIHCGIDVFNLVKSNNGWRILSIYDTRRKENCNEDPVKDINTLMDAWHLAAAKGDEDTFFGSMTKEAIYIGTDKTERWLRDELKEWSKKYFDRPTAWDFKPIERKVYLSDDGQYGWFNETLNTWMGVCRGSGILTKKPVGWKIEQYHLSVTIDNDKINGFLDVIGMPHK